MTITSRTTRRTAAATGRPSRPRLARIVVPTAVAALALAGCGGTSPGASTSSSTSASPTETPGGTAGAGATATASGTPALDAARLQAIGTCLRDAGLPTPTSTDAVRAGSEILTLLRDPRAIAALRKCGIDLPGLQASSS
jgi:hypothetical protein